MPFLIHSVVLILGGIEEGEESKIRDKRPKKKVKMETKPVFLPGEVIDLTV